MVISNVKDGVVDTSSTTMSSLSKGDTAQNASTINLEEFLNLMVAEMQNQDPLEPTDNSDYMAQMATFSQVEATNQMNTKVKEQYAAELVGCNVVIGSEFSNTGITDGTVDHYELIDDTIYLGIDGKLYDIDDLKAVMEDGYYKNVYSSTNA